MNGVVLALGLTFVAGLATAIGSAVAFFARRTNYRFLSIAAGFSAGVMFYVSFVEIFLKGGNPSLSPTARAGTLGQCRSLLCGHMTIPFRPVRRVASLARHRQGSRKCIIPGR
jgi:zinc transporter ZupT